MQPTTLLLAACLIIAVTGFAPKKDASSETAAIQQVETQVKSRILIVPGLLGSQLKLKISGEKSTSGIGKLLHEMRMNYSPKKEKWTEKKGNSVKALGFEKTNKVECLKETCNGKFAYFKTFVDFFVEKGYERDVDIRAAPYDWRLSTRELNEQGYFAKVETLIEKMNRGGNSNGVNIVAHGLGGLNMLHFLNTREKDWKDKNVNSFIPLGSPFGGAVEALVALLYGGKDYSVLKCQSPTSNTCRIEANVARRFPSMFMLLPRDDVFGSQTIVTRNNQTFTAAKYEELFKKAQDSTSWSKYKHVRGINKDLTEDPGVPTYCMYGLTDTPNTPERITLEKGFPDSGKGMTLYGEGDNVVNKISLEACTKFAPKFDVIQGVNHQEIVRDESVLTKIYDYIRPRKDCMIDTGSD